VLLTIHFSMVETTYTELHMRLLANFVSCNSDHLVNIHGLERKNSAMLLIKMLSVHGLKVSALTNSTKNSFNIVMLSSFESFAQDFDQVLTLMRSSSPKSFILFMDIALPEEVILSTIKQKVSKENLNALFYVSTKGVPAKEPAWFQVFALKNHFGVAINELKFRALTMCIVEDYDLQGMATKSVSLTWYP